MTKPPLIGITCGEIRNSQFPWMQVNYAQGHAYSDAIVRAGGIPVILPIIEDLTVLRELYTRCDGILFAGGNDIDPDRFGQAPHPATGNVSARRDAQESELLEWSLADDKPLFGICRGMQLLNIQLGGTLHQHIPDAFPEAQDHEASKAHENTAELAHVLKLDPTSLLAHVLGADSVEANSQHHQAVDTLGTGLVATAWAEDGIVEALELPNKKFAIAVQLHPEGIEAEAEPLWRKVFEAFVAASAEQS